MAYQKTDKITLKWGTLKAWEFRSNKCRELMAEYCRMGTSMSAIMQEDTPEQKALICKIIDASTGKRILLDWDGKYVSKKEAKEYVLGYGQS